MAGKTLRMKELMCEVYERLDLPYNVVKEVIIDFVNLAGEHLVEGDSLVIRGLGSWKARYTKFTGRGPKGMTRIIHDFTPSVNSNKQLLARRVKKETIE